jgi:hypothetical protein
MLQDAKARGLSVAPITPLQRLLIAAYLAESGGLFVLELAFLGLGRVRHPEYGAFLVAGGLVAIAVLRNVAGGVSGAIYGSLRWALHPTLIVGVMSSLAILLPSGRLSGPISPLRAGGLLAIGVTLFAFLRGRARVRKAQ